MKFHHFGFRRIGMLVLAMAAFSQRAHAASWSMSDGLDSNVAANWGCWQSESAAGNSCLYSQGTFILNVQSSGIGMTNMYTVNGVTGWSDTGRSVSLTPFQQGRRLSCTAEMTVLPHYLTRPDVQLEVIDSATWTYISTQRLKFSAASLPFKKVTIVTPAWEPPSKNIYVRIGIIGSGTFAKLFVDGLAVRCSF
jgi:hypothetical protein